MSVIILTGCDMDENIAEQSLSGHWHFTYDPKTVGETAGYSSPFYKKNNWKTLNVPGPWGDSEFDGVAWYACNFKLKDLLRNKKIALMFKGVDDNAVIYLNGQKIHEHQGYNVRFHIPITATVKKQHQNHLVVKILDTGGTGGITGEVYLKPYQNETELLKSAYFEKKLDPAPEWVNSAVIYEVFPRAYSQAGDLESIRKDLPRLQQLGVNCIWLMPIFPVGQAHKKGSLGSPYAIADYLKINPRLGTAKDLKNLIRSAHQRNMKVIIDIACNHCAWDNKLLKDHPDWFTKNKAGEIIPPQGTDWYDVADFDYRKTNLRKYMQDVLIYWIREFDIDGYRCDVAELVPYDFWDEAIKKLKKIKPDILMLAEGSHPELYLHGFQLTYAWNTRTALHKIIQKDRPAKWLEKVLTKEHYQYPRHGLRMRFTENHDLTRAVDYFGYAESCLAGLVAFTLPGVPMLYNGQEIGAISKPSLFEKEVVNWQEVTTGQLKEFYQQLFRIRKEHQALRSDHFTYLNNSAENQVISYIRPHDDHSILVVANTDSQPCTVELQLNHNLPKNNLVKLTLLMGVSDFKYHQSVLSLNLTAYNFALFRID